MQPFHPEGSVRRLLAKPKCLQLQRTTLKKLARFIYLIVSFANTD